MQYFPLDIGLRKAAACVHPQEIRVSFILAGREVDWLASVVFVNRILVSPLRSITYFLSHACAVFIVHLRKAFIFHWCIDSQALGNSDKKYSRSEVYYY